MTALDPGGSSCALDDRLQMLLDAFTAMAGEDDEHGALQRAADVARLAARADYGAAVLADVEGGAHLVHAGVPARRAARLPGPAQGLGVLGAVLAGETLRMSHVVDAPAPAGLPAHHPPVEAFLGVPVTAETGGEVLGALYLSNRTGAPPFTAADEALVLALARQCAQVVVRLRAARQVRDLAARLEKAERVRTAALARMTDGLDPVEAVDRLLDTLREQLGMPMAALTRVGATSVEIQRTSGGVPLPGIHAGCSFPGPTLCHGVVAGTVSVVPDLQARPDLAALPAASGVGAYAGAAVVVDGRTYGSLCVMSDRATQLSDADSTVLGVLADLVGHQLARLAHDAAVRTAREDAVGALLAPGVLRVVLQPVVELRHGRVVAVEALARFPGPGSRPDLVFAEAAAMGLGVDLELAAVGAAVALLPLIPPDVDLSVNAGPATVVDPRLLELLAVLPAGRVVVELTEHEDLGEHPGLAGALRRLRAAGTRVAIDDAGAGYAGLRSVVDVAPEVLKMDISLVRGVEDDPARQFLVRALVGLAKDMGSTLVAEGVETPGELDALRRLGVGRIQGYLLGRPVPPAQVDFSPRRLVSLPTPRSALA